MNYEIAAECTKLSEDERITFFEVVMRLDKGGIEAYQANLLVPNKVYYQDNEAFEVPLKVKSQANVIAPFDQQRVIKALRSIQSKEIGYQEFLKQILEGGVIFYLVFIKGRKAIYFGRNGEQYIESFPF